MARSLLISLLLVATPALAAGPAPKTKGARAGSATAPADSLADCLGVDAIVTETHALLAYYETPQPDDSQTAVASRRLVLATHDAGRLVVSARKAIAKLPAKVRKAALAFCGTPAGKAYTKLVDGFFVYPGEDAVFREWPSVSGDAALVKRTADLLASTRLVDVSWDQTMLDLRDMSGARAIILRLHDHPKDSETARAFFRLQLMHPITAGVRNAYEKHRPIERRGLLRGGSVLLAKVPKAEVAAMIAFFETDAGKAVQKATEDAVHAAMEGAWGRMMRRFETGEIDLGPAKAKK